MLNIFKLFSIFREKPLSFLGNFISEKRSEEIETGKSMDLQGRVLDVRFLELALIRYSLEMKQLFYGLVHI